MKGANSTAPHCINTEQIFSLFRWASQTLTLEVPGGTAEVGAGVAITGENWQAQMKYLIIYPIISGHMSAADVCPWTAEQTVPSPGSQPTLLHWSQCNLEQSGSSEHLWTTPYPSYTKFYVLQASKFYELYPNHPSSSSCPKATKAQRGPAQGVGFLWWNHCIVPSVFRKKRKKKAQADN